LGYLLLGISLITLMPAVCALGAVVLNLVGPDRSMVARIVSPCFAPTRRAGVIPLPPAFDNQSANFIEPNVAPRREL
jgi:hypothetical protein